MAAEGAQDAGHPVTRAMARKFERYGIVGTNAILVKEAIEQPVRLEGRIKQLMILHRIEKDRGAVPVLFLIREGTIIIFLAERGEPALARDVLDHDGASAPVLLRRSFRAVIIGPGRKMDARCDLLGACEIFMRGVAETVRVNRNDALIALHIAPLIDGKGEIAIAH